MITTLILTFGAMANDPDTATETFEKRRLEREELTEQRWTVRDRGRQLSALDFAVRVGDAENAELIRSGRARRTNLSATIAVAGGGAAISGIALTLASITHSEGLRPSWLGTGIGLIGTGSLTTAIGLTKSERNLREYDFVSAHYEVPQAEEWIGKYNLMLRTELELEEE